LTEECDAIECERFPSARFSIGCLFSGALLRCTGV
jgi:hypothetical protein